MLRDQGRQGGGGGRQASEEAEQGDREADSEGQAGDFGLGAFAYFELGVADDGVVILILANFELLLVDIGFVVADDGLGENLNFKKKHI